VKLLFDENLSRKLVARLADVYPDSSHVTTLGLQRASDRQVWDYAGGHDYALVSKDSDFNDLAFVHGPPPKVIWLRVGNATTEAIAELLTSAAGTITAFVDDYDDAVLTLRPPPSRPRTPPNNPGPRRG
jgi:predicted nuclease of predicted toxin-antitoxin system